ncbi:MAG: hypothetical protein ACK56Q_03170, partial [Pirellulaceae bacterium]
MTPGPEGRHNNCRWRQPPDPLRQPFILRPLALASDWFWCVRDREDKVSPMMGGQSSNDVTLS